VTARYWKDLGGLFALALAIRLLTAWPVRQPGYTDVAFYATGSQQLYTGQGFREPFIWNYLDPPTGLPHPGFEYWMPLASILGWLGLVLLGDSFWALQLPFVLISALLPLVAYLVAWDLTSQRRHAVLAGLLTVFPGFFALGFVLPETFAPFALAGSVCLWAAGRGLRDHRPAWFGLAGLAAGFGHLTRADGLLLAGIVLLTAIFAGARASASHSPEPDSALPPQGQNRRRIEPARSGAQTLIASTFLVVSGYLLVMGPWFVRNWVVFGALFPGGGTKTMFLTTYDDMFAYEQPLTLEAYWAWGWSLILKSKWEALLLNLQRVWIECLLIVLPPFAALGLWQLRRERLLWPFFLYLPTLFLTMTLVFTFPGMRGALYHSSSAWLPFLFAAIGPGLEVALRWAARRFQNWHVRRAWPVFSAGLVGLAAFVTLFGLWRSGVLTGDWNRRGRPYLQIGSWLQEQGESETVVMVGDTPTFAWHTGHPTIAVPNEPLDTILNVADRYGAQYLVLDQSRPRTTDELYAGDTTHSRLALRFSLRSSSQSWQVYEVLP
jgi:hypothetical protein